MSIASDLHRPAHHDLAESHRPVAEWALHAAEPTILIAEDDEDLRDLISFKLETAGYRTITADNGNTTLSLVYGERPDAVVLDVGLPGMDGITVCHRLHSHAATAQVPVIMLSGRARESDVSLGYTAGADHYMTKPFSPADLVRRIGWLLLSNGG